MLVVSRKPDEGIIISDNIEVRILEISRENVKIGIAAPRDIKIVRSELLETSSRNMEAALELPADILKDLMENSADALKAHKTIT